VRLAFAARQRLCRALKSSVVQASFAVRLAALPFGKVTNRCRASPRTTRHSLYRAPLVQLHGKEINMHTAALPGAQAGVTCPFAVFMHTAK
jgi:hypothetical protein